MNNVCIPDNYSKGEYKGRMHVNGIWYNISLSITNRTTANYWMGNAIISSFSSNTIYHCYKGYSTDSAWTIVSLNL